MLFHTSRTITAVSYPVTCVVPTSIANGDGLQTPLANWWSPNDSNVFWNGDTMVENGVITAGPYTVVAVDTETVIPGDGVTSNNWDWNYFDSGKVENDGDQFLLLVDTNTFTRTDQGWMDATASDPSYFNGKFIYEPEFNILQYGYEDVNGSFEDNGHDNRYYKMQGANGGSCYRLAEGEQYYSAFGNEAHSGDDATNGKVERYNIDEIGMTPDGIFYLKFTMKNQTIQYKDFSLNTLSGGPIYPGFCRFGLAKLN